MKRDTVKRKGKKQILVWVPEHMIPAMKKAVALNEDSDRSKFVRGAIRKELSRHGIKMEASV